MKDALKTILEIQELDMKMLRLMRVKKERLKEIDQIEALRKELHQQLTEKETEISEFGKQSQALEQKIQEITAKMKKLESQQGSVKKVEEFNALTQEMTALEREKINTEQKVSDLVDKRVAGDEVGAVHDFGHITQKHGGIRSHADRHRFEVFDVLYHRVHRDHRKPVADLEIAGGTNRIRGGDRRNDFVG
jgi:chromosome segregation ATPase